MAVTHIPPNKLKIEELFVWVSVDENGNEGVCATLVAGIMMPLIAADKAMLVKIRPLALRVKQQATGRRKVRLIRFTKREELETL